jgi:hypothetical protein
MNQPRYFRAEFRGYVGTRNTIRHKPYTHATVQLYQDRVTGKEAAEWSFHRSLDNARRNTKADAIVQTTEIDAAAYRAQKARDNDMDTPAGRIRNALRIQRDTLWRGYSEQEVAGRLMLRRHEQLAPGARERAQRSVEWEDSWHRHCTDDFLRADLVRFQHMQAAGFAAVLTARDKIAALEARLARALAAEQEAR